MVKANTKVAMIEEKVRSGYRITKDGRTLELESVIGEGSGGPVYYAVDASNPSSDATSSDSPKCFAVKVFQRLPKTAREARHQMSEYRLHARASAIHVCSDYRPEEPAAAKYWKERHPHILPLYDMYVDRECLFFVMEYCEAGDLWDLVIVERELWGNDPLIKSLFLHVVSAVEYCHNLKIFHRDIKPENVVVKRIRDKETGEETLSAMLADFGLAKGCSKTHDFRVGTAGYRSPEGMGLTFMAGGYYNSYADVWALGCLLAFMITGHTPWEEATLTDECFMHYLNGSGYHIRRCKEGYLLVEPQCDFSSDCSSPAQRRESELNEKATLLRRNLPISMDAALILAGIFDVYDIGARTELEDLIPLIKATTVFSMVLDDVVCAPYRVRWIAAEMSNTPGLYLNEEEREKEAEKDKAMLERRRECACRDCVAELRREGVQVTGRSTRQRVMEELDAARVLADMKHALPVGVLSSSCGSSGSSGSSRSATALFSSSHAENGSTTTSQSDSSSDSGLTTDDSFNADTTSSVGVITPPDALGPLRPVDTVPDIDINGIVNDADDDGDVEMDATTSIGPKVSNVRGTSRALEGKQQA